MNFFFDDGTGLNDSPIPRPVLVHMRIGNDGRRGEV